MKRSHRVPLVLLTLAIAASALSAPRAEPTRITVRVISKGAKFVGTSMGGAEIVVRDVLTGEVLARGVTSGSTGDTKRIMEDPHAREGLMSSEDSARFDAMIGIDEPRLIEVSAYGPRAQRQAANRASSTQWVVPGRHVEGGDGWLLEIPGFVVDVLAPPSHVKLAGAPQTMRLAANVTMMCGCPVKPGGMWDADRFEVRALLRRNGEAVGEMPMSYAGSTSQFEADWTVDRPGAYEAIVFAYDAGNGNTGVDSTTFVVTPPKP